MSEIGITPDAIGTFTEKKSSSGFVAELVGSESGSRPKRSRTVPALSS